MGHSSTAVAGFTWDTCWRVLTGGEANSLAWSMSQTLLQGVKTAVQLLALNKTGNVESGILHETKGIGQGGCRGRDTSRKEVQAVHFLILGLIK